MSVSYGMNSVKSRGFLNKIDFAYEDIGASASEFFLEDRKGSISKRIATITTSSNEQVFRKYSLTYDVTSDKSPCRFARLSSIREENGNGDSLTPTKLIWTPLTDGRTSLTRINDPSIKIDSSISLSKSGRSYMAADVTGDGISDIILMSPGTRKELNKDTYHTFVIISRSEVTKQKQVKYKDPIIYRLPPSVDLSNNECAFEVKSVMGGLNLSDIDGDGINDLIFPKRQYTGNSWSSENLYVIYGKDVVAGKDKVNQSGYQIKNSTTPPIYISCDFNGDGIDEVLCMETSSVGGLYQASTIIFNETGYAIQKTTNFDISGKPEKIFCGDYNNDGLIDILVLHKEGYKIFYNRGGKITDIHFDSSMSKTGTTMKDQIRIDQGDFNGDGLLDFV